MIYEAILLSLTALFVVVTVYSVRETSKHKRCIEAWHAHWMATSTGLYQEIFRLKDKLAKFERKRGKGGRFTK